MQIQNIIHQWFQVFAVTTLGVAAAPFVFLVLLYFPFLDLPKFGVNIDVSVKCDKCVQVDSDDEDDESEVDVEVPESKEGDEEIRYPHIYESIFAGVQPTLLERTQKLLDIMEHRQLTPDEEVEFADVIESRNKMKKETEEWMNARAEAYFTKLAPSESSAPASDETRPAS